MARYFEQIRLRCTRAEKIRWDKKAARAQLSLSEWIREQLRGKCEAIEANEPPPRKYGKRGRPRNSSIEPTKGWVKERDGVADGEGAETDRVRMAGRVQGGLSGSAGEGANAVEEGEGGCRVEDDGQTKADDCGSVGDKTSLRELLLAQSVEKIGAVEEPEHDGASLVGGDDVRSGMGKEICGEAASESSETKLPLDPAR